jgi:hypothetical protein
MCKIYITFLLMYTRSHTCISMMIDEHEHSEISRHIFGVYRSCPQHRDNN